MTSTYKTYGGAISPFGIKLYCYNDKITNIIEIVRMEDMAFNRAIQRQHKLFDVYYPEFTDYNKLIEVSRN